MKREFQKLKIDYLHKPELGVIYQVRAPYVEGYISDNSFKGWYDWHLNNIDFNMEVFVKKLKDSGTCCFMCMEEFAKPNGSQKYHCHRDFLADKILNYNPKDSLLKFEERKDL